ncbi:MAG: BatD family protein [Gammaproteobacteria bacterium]|jgi:hypothetical protein
MATPFWIPQIAGYARSGQRAVPTGALLLLLCLLFAGPAAAQTLDAQVDRTQITEGETVTLNLSATGDVKGSPDLTPLSKDFDVLSQSQGTSINIVNGRTSSSRQWRLMLMPKHGGELTIPALRLGTLESRPIALKVQPAGTASSTTGGATPPVMLEVDSEPGNPYVQSQVVYKVRLLSRVPLREASLSEPGAGDALIEPLGDDKHYTTQRHGTTYQVTERRYAIFPQHSGELSIESPVLAASIPVQDGQRRHRQGRMFGGDPFADIEKMFGRSPLAGFPSMGSLFEETQPVRLRGRAVTLDVRPQPAAVQGSWLPAKNLTLTESWSPDPPVFRVGEPVTRSVSLIAEGLSSAQLPELSPPLPAGIKRYPDQPQNETQVRGDDVVSTKTQKTALVPSAPGTLTLPEMRIRWWDTTTQQSRVATLPERRIDVLAAQPGTATPAGPTPTPVEQPAADQAGAVATPPAAATAPPTAARVRSGAPVSGFWPWLTAAMAAGWLLTLLLWARSRHRQSTRARPDRGGHSGSAQREALAQSRSQLKTACLSGDPGGAARALLAWSRARWPDAPPKGLTELSRRFATDAARRDTLALDRLLYDKGNDSWDGRAAWSVFEQAIEHAARESDASSAPPLPALYPQHGQLA